jgi:hypothetical protein
MILMNKQVKQQGCEWMALVAMSNILVSSAHDLARVYSQEDLIVLGMAMLQIKKQMPDGPICGTSAEIVFEEEQITVLVMLVDWFDDYLLQRAKWLEKHDADAFAQKYVQVGLIKRNLKLYAKDLENSEPREGTA